MILLSHFEITFFSIGWQPGKIVYFDGSTDGVSTEVRICSGTSQIERTGRDINRHWRTAHGLSVESVRRVRTHGRVVPGRRPDFGAGRRRPMADNICRLPAIMSEFGGVIQKHTELSESTNAFMIS